MARDNTANGSLAAHTAKAAIPSSEAKASAWAGILGGELSNLEQRAAITGFNRVHDAALLSEYVESYFAAARGIWESKSHEIAQQIIVGLFPAAQVSEATLEASDVFLNTLGSDSPALRRLVTEARDSVVRSLAAQRADV